MVKVHWQEEVFRKGFIFQAEAAMSKRWNEVELTAEQEAEAQRLAGIVTKRTQEEVLQMCRLLVSKKDHEMFGKTEFEMRDRVHDLGSHVLETALNERKKRGTKGRA
jgi:hypothetical protein